jgi:hypothetical protein
MPSAAKLQRRAENKQAHAIAQRAQFASVNPAEIAGRIFTSKEEEELPEHMRDGHVLRRERGPLTNEACVNRICDLIARGVTETEARRYIGVSVRDWGRWRFHNESNLLEKIAFAFKLQHIATADECIRILQKLRGERRVALKQHNEAMRKYNRELSEWYAVPEGERDERPAEPVYDGPSELDLRMDTAMVTHLQWKLESLSEEHVRKTKQDVDVNVTQNIYQEIKDAKTPQDAMQSYIKLIDQRPE